MPETHVSIHEARRKVEEILGAVHYETTSLTHKMVKAFRNGADPHKARLAYQQIQAAVAESLAAYEAAIAQPETKPAIRPQVEL